MGSDYKIHDKSIHEDQPLVLHDKLLGAIDHTFQIQNILSQ